MKRAAWIAGALAGLAVVVLAGGFFLARTEWAEARIEALAEEAIGREVDLEGFALLPRWPPTVRVDTVRVANPDWAKTRHLIDAADLRASFDASALLSGRAVITSLSVARAAAGLEQDGKRATWQFGERGEEPARFRLEKARIEDGDIFYAEHDRDTALDVQVKGGAGTDEAKLELQASGRFRGQEASADATLPGLLFSADQAIRVEGRAQMGATKASVDGTFSAAASGLGEVDAQVSLSGQSLAGLEGLLGFELPATPAYEVAGALKHEGQTWHLTDFIATVGQSDLRGDFSYAGKGERGFVSATLESDMLDFDDLGRKAREAKAGGGLIPGAPFQTAGWDAVDAEVRLQAKQVVDAPFGTLADMKVRMHLERGRVELEPLDFGVAGGRVEAKVVLDARQAPLFGSVNAELRGLDAGTFVEALKGGGTSLGALHGRIDLTGRGDSLQGLLGSSDGDVVLMMNEGNVSGLLVEALGMDLGEALLVLGTKKKDPVALRCAVADFNVRRGIARTDVFVVDTSDTRIVVEGSVNLGQENLDLVVRPYPKDASVGSARTPIRVSGPLKDPDVAPRPGPLAARGGAAVLLGLVNPLLAVLPFIEAGAGEDADCQALLEAARKEAAAASVGP